MVYKTFPTGKQFSERTKQGARRETFGANRVNANHFLSVDSRLLERARPEVAGEVAEGDRRRRPERVCGKGFYPRALPRY